MRLLRFTPWIYNVLAFLVLSPAVADKPTASEDAPLVREIYVPYDEFAARAKNTKDAVVMPLAEYRALVLKALAEKGEKSPEAVLPPVQSRRQRSVPRRRSARQDGVFLFTVEGQRPRRRLGAM